MRGLSASPKNAGSPHHAVIAQADILSPDKDRDNLSRGPVLLQQWRYGDSYIIDPHGEIVVRSRRHEEDFLFADIDPNISDRSWNVGRSMWSAREFGQQLQKLSNPQR